jgi:uncharacterized protein (TIGR00297 family)
MFNFIVCTIIVGLINAELGLGLLVWHLLAISFFATSLELFSGRGLDNVTVTLGASFLSYFFINFDGAKNYVVPILVTPLMIAFAYKNQALTIGGIISAIIIDVVVSVALGNFGFIILLAFFVGGLITDKIKKREKNKGRKKKSDIYHHIEQRNHRQVLANSAVSVTCAILFLFTKDRGFLISFIASLAEALADTTASGIGSLSNKTYDLFRMRKCRAGLSGGMSFVGTFSALISTFIITIIAVPFINVSAEEGMIIIISAFLGMVFDSFLGSLLQIKFKCPNCGEIIEQPTHCNVRAVKCSGIGFVDNNLVNFISTLFTAALAFFLYII